MPQPQEAHVGDSVAVISGTHEGRFGTITQIRDIQAGYLDPEAYAVVGIHEQDCFGDWHDDHIVVPVRRLKPTR